MPVPETGRGWETRGILIEYKRGTNAWAGLPGMGAISVSTPAAGTTSDETTLSVSQTLSRAEPPSVSVAIPRWHLADPSTEDMEALQQSGDLIQVLYYQPNELSLWKAGGSGAANTVAISTAGALTVVGTGNIDFKEQRLAGKGSQLKVLASGTWGAMTATYTYHTIKTVPTDGALSGVTLAANPSSAVAAMQYDVVQAAWYRPAFFCRVSNFSTDHPSGGIANATLDLECDTALPGVKIGAVVRP